MGICTSQEQVNNLNFLIKNNNVHSIFCAKLKVTYINNLSPANPHPVMKRNGLVKNFLG